MSAYLDWHVGMNVVCIETWAVTPGHGYGDERGPVSGETYTIAEIGYLNPTDPRKILVRLTEISNERRPYRDVPSGWEQAFRVSRFRPIQTRKSDISIFTAMLNTTKKVVDA